MKQTTRALLVNPKGLCFLALHNHILHENKNKWGTVGGIRDQSDIDLRACMARELEEEFGSNAAKTFIISDEIAVIEKYSTKHHFFKVTTTLDRLKTIQPEEILDARFFSLKEIKLLKQKGQ